MNHVSRLLALAFALSTPASAESDWNWSNDVFKPVDFHEKDLAPFLKPAAFDTRQVFKTERLPNIVVTLKGTVIVTTGWKNVQVRRSEDGGNTWGDVIPIRPGINGGGRSWKASEPVPLMGCGEACIVELSNGTLHYNTRRHWTPEKEDSLWRWTSTSTDGDQTWQNATRSDILLDGGKTWPVRRQAFEGNFAYSSLNAGRPGTPHEGWISLHYEGGPQGGSTYARFNLSWTLAGETTGDGEVPAWANKNEKL